MTENQLLPDAATTTSEFDVVVVGAGFAGMYAVHHLRSLGFSVHAFEAGRGVGGTWFWNRYPGARCDIPSVEYSYSFDADLQQEWEWSQRYPTQPEMLAYANHVADRFDLRRDISFETKVVSAHFNDATERWDIRTDYDDAVVARFLVMATGCLSVPRVPDVPGLADFTGTVLHTGQWPPRGVDVSGQRVGVIGTGASGIQSIPYLAEQAAQLTVFQRTAQFSVSGANTTLDPAELAEVKAHYPEHRERARRSFGGTMLRANRDSALEVSDEERVAQFEKAWTEGGFAFLASFRDITTDARANELAAQFVRDKIHTMVHDPAIADLLSPTDHPLGTKRICIDSGYYTSFNRDNVSLVNLRQTPIERITATGIATTDREYDLDAIIFATGFDAMTGAILNVDIRGRGGAELREAWSAGPRAYLGLSVSGFPNFFTITGPGSPSVLSNVIAAGEQHVEWIGACLAALRDQDVATIEADPVAELEWVNHVREVAEQTLYPAADSWYMGANIPGKPRVFMPYVGGVGSYRRKCDAVAANGYDGFQLTPNPNPKNPG